MKQNRSILFVLILVFLLTACRSEPAPASPAIDIITLQITPELDHWRGKIADCARNIPQLGIITKVLPYASLETDQSDLTIRLGTKQEGDHFAYVLGIEEIVIVAGSDVPISEISLESLQNIYLGLFKNWNEVPEVLALSQDFNQPIQTLSYPAGESLRHLFEISYLSSESINSSPQVFSTIPYITSYLQDHPAAVGYLLKSQVPPNVQTLSITDTETFWSEQYVLAVTPEEPEGKLLEYLLCLQEE
jgi:hypothetical protein